jgi:hypothetical protein
MMKKIAKTAIAVILAVAMLAACGAKTEDNDTEATADENTRRTSFQIDEENASKTDSDFAEEHGIVVEGDYLPYGNKYWGKAVFSSDGTFTYEITEGETIQSTWTADPLGVYVTNDNGEEQQLDIAPYDDIFELDGVIFALVGYDSSIGVHDNLKCDSDHEWLDIVDFKGERFASYTNLKDNGEAETDVATVLIDGFDVYITQNNLDGNNKIVILSSDDNGVTYHTSDGYTYTEYDDEDEYLSDRIAAVEESFGDRSEYADEAEALGVLINTNYICDLDDNTYIYINDNGIFYLHSSNSKPSEPYLFEIDGNIFSIYNPDDPEIGNFEFNGSTFYQENGDLEYEAE